MGAAREFVAPRSGLLFLGINGSSAVRAGSYTAEISIKDDLDNFASALQANVTRKFVRVGIGDWANSEIAVSKGDLVSIGGSGEITLKNGIRSGPGGTYILNSDKAMSNHPTGALIAVVGRDATDFVFVGAAREFVAPRSGLLFLGINGSSAIRAGSYAVEVTVGRR